MREYNKNATVDTAALCKTFSGNGEESWCEATRPTTGCLYIYPEESAIELRLFSGCDPHVDDIIAFILRDKDVKEMLARYYQKGRKDRYSMRWRCGMSGCEDVYINFVDEHGLVMGGKHLMHVSCYDKLAGIKRMYIGDFAECAYELAQHGHHFDNGTSFRYTKPHFAESAGTTVHRL